VLLIDCAIDRLRSAVGTVLLIDCAIDRLHSAVGTVLLIDCAIDRLRSSVGTVLLIDCAIDRLRSAVDVRSTHRHLATGRIIRCTDNRRFFFCSGAGGSIAFADPVNGLSIAILKADYTETRLGMEVQYSTILTHHTDCTHCILFSLYSLYSLCTALCTVYCTHYTHYTRLGMEVAERLIRVIRNHAPRPSPMRLHGAA
jgi:hypothetical protein